MRTKRRDRDRPEPDTPWDEIVPGLWMGGHHWTGPGGIVQPVVAAAEFDLVISLYARPGHGPDPAVEHLVREVPDAPLTGEQIRALQQLALRAARAVRDGRTTLVRCNSGFNRSGLVVARTLVELGHDVDAAIALIRQKRSPWALNSTLGVTHSRHDVAAELADVAFSALVAITSLGLDPAAVLDSPAAPDP